MQWRHAVHKGLHEALLLDVLVVIITCGALLLGFDKLTVGKVRRRAHFHESPHCSEVTILDCLEQRCLPVDVQYVHFGSEASIFCLSRPSQYLDQVLNTVWVSLAIRTTAFQR